MALDLANYEQKATDSIKAFWGNREKAKQKQVEAEIHGIGQGVGNGGEMLVAGHGVFVRFFASFVRFSLYPWNRTMRKWRSLNSGVLA